MQFYKFWTKAKHPASDNAGGFKIECWGFSNESLEDAFRVGERRAAAVASAIVDGKFQAAGYYEGERPFREEVVEEFADEGRQVAIISRNNYGVLVLNTPIVFFADVDKPAGSPIKSFLGLFKNKTGEPSFEQQLVEKIETICRQDASLGLRLYRTTNGYRILITSRQIPANEASSNDLLKMLGSDRLYVSLCKTQDCYRARLTPKPWRCNYYGPPTKFPYRSAAEEQEFRDWLQAYDSARAEFATCAVIGDFGSSFRDPVVEKIIQLHDHYTLDDDKPLA